MTQPLPAGRRPSGWTRRRTRHIPPLDRTCASTSCVVGGGILGLLPPTCSSAPGAPSPCWRPTASRPASPATRRRRYRAARADLRPGPLHFGGEGARHYAEANAAGLELIAGSAPSADRLRLPPPLRVHLRRGPGDARQAPQGGRRGARGRAARRARRRRRPALGRRRRRAAGRPGRVPPAPLPARDRRRVRGDGSHVSERTRVTGVDDGDACRVETEVGRRGDRRRRGDRHPLPDARPRPVLRPALRRALLRDRRARPRARPAGHVPLDGVAVALRPRDARTTAASC